MNNHFEPSSTTTSAGKRQFLGCVWEISVFIVPVFIVAFFGASIHVSGEKSYFRAALYFLMYLVEPPTALGRYLTAYLSLVGWFWLIGAIVKKIGASFAGAGEIKGREKGPGAELAD